MGKGYLSESELEFRRELNRSAAENRYKEFLQETYKMKEKDYQDYLDDIFDVDSPYMKIGEDWEV